MPRTDSRYFNGLRPLELPMSIGLFLFPSRFAAPPGSLSDCRNFEVVDGAYEESQGLTLVGPTLDRGLEDFWHMDLVAADVTVTGTVLVGDELYWYFEDGVTVAGKGRIYYANFTTKVAEITIDRVSGASPRRATSLYTTSGATLVVSTTGDTFVHQTQLGLTFEEYWGDKFLGALTASQREIDATWGQFKPDPLGVQGISGVFHLNDSIYAVRDFWGGKFTAGEEEPSIGDLVTVDEATATGTFTALVGGYKLTSGSWEGGDAEGTVYLYPSASTELDLTKTDNWDNSTTITNTTTGNTLGTTLATGNKQYDNKGLLWKRDKDAQQGGWQLIDMGYSVAYDEGQVAPIAELSPLLTTDSLDKIVDSGYIDPAAPATEYPSTGTYSAWSGLSNYTSASPGVYTSTTIGTSDFSRVIEVPLNATTIDGTVEILGVQVELTCHQTVGTDVKINKVQLRNSRSGAEQYLSVNRSEQDTLTTTPGTTYEYGAQLDLWGLDEILSSDVNGGNIDLLVQFENTSGASTRTVNVDEIQIRWHYAVKGQKVYFYDGSTDVDTGTLVAYQVFDGDWSTDDAIGWMSLYDLSTPSAIAPGTQIRSAASGAGDLLAEVRRVEKNYLPSLEEIDAVGTLYQSRRGSFSGSETEEAAYVCTGASPAFTLNVDDVFSFIRLPVKAEKDSPRYVEIHRNHLMLATGSHLLVSSVGQPNNFNTYDGATTWSTSRDRITGLAQSANGTTMVACKDSIHVFTGSGATGQDAFAMQILTDNSGARDYTITNLLGNVFLDYAGVTTADISDKYGGFDLGRKAGHVRQLMQDVIGSDTDETTVGNRVIGAIPVRKKNQYRIYLADGNILTATFPETPDQPLAFTRQHYAAYYEEDTRGYEALFAPTAIDSAALSTGEESIIIGTRLGHVMRVDPGYMNVLSYANKTTGVAERADELRVWTFMKFLDLTPIHGSDPSSALHHKSMEVYLEHAGYSEINRVYATDYERIGTVPNIKVPSTTIGNKVKVGNADVFPGKRQSDYFSWYIDDITDGLTVRFLKFGGLNAEPLRLTSIFDHVDIKGEMKNNIQDGRAYEVVEGTLPQDFLIVGITGNAAAAGNTGTVMLDVNLTGVTGNAAAAGGTGVVTLGPDLWTWDRTNFTFDSTTETFDGST